MARKERKQRAPKTPRTPGQPNKFVDKIQEVMYGRNGGDELGRDAAILTFIVIVLNMFLSGNEFLYVLFTALSWIGIIYVFFRMLSKNVTKRQGENRAYLGWRYRVLTPFRNTAKKFTLWRKYHKTHLLITCDGCGTTLRVPKGKGKVRVTCPKCKKKFDVKS